MQNPFEKKPDPLEEERQRIREQGAHARSIDTTSEESEKEWRAWQEMRSPEKDTVPAPPSLDAKCAKKISSYKGRCFHYMTAEEKSDLYAYLGFFEEHGTSRQAHDAWELRSLLDPELGEPIDLSPALFQKLAELTGSDAT